MTPNQEDALYEFLENMTEPFTLNDVVSFIRIIEPKRNGRLSTEIAALIDSRNIAFRLGPQRWVSRRGCFEPARFVISPTRLELLNGILIPGHRCVPFANSILLPNEYRFYWRGSPIPVTTTEGPPEDFYPYYSILGEEYAPQYVAQDNPENESAFNSDPYEDPPEVSIQTLDMRNIYRETSFVPGDRFVARTLDWKAGVFELERVGKDAWSQAEIYAWVEAAEAGFEDSFKFLGPGSSTDEQIAYAYWYGGKRMREVPACSLEEFLYEKTGRIEATPYGIETRFWYAGKEIPDRKALEGTQTAAERTIIEDILYQNGIPVSEYVVQSYVRDALYRNETSIPQIVTRIAPKTVEMDEEDLFFLSDYVTDVFAEYSGAYSLFLDQAVGPIRQRVGELHTAVIELSARLRKGDIDGAWLPKHTFVVLSQIQTHAAMMMEDLDAEGALTEPELEMMDNSLDSMIETYGEIKELIDEAMNSFRRKNLSIVRSTEDTGSAPRLTIQLGLGGTGVWRRLILPGSCSLRELHKLIQLLFGWNSAYKYRFTVEDSSADTAEDSSSDAGKTLEPDLPLADLNRRGFFELLYEYGAGWTVKVMFLSTQETDGETEIRCVAGAGAAPPGFIDGPLRFKKFLSALEKGKEPVWPAAGEKAGVDYRPDDFDLESCNRLLNAQGTRQSDEDRFINNRE